MDVVAVLTALGGVATRADLVRRTSRREVDAALARASIVRQGRGRYAVPTVSAAVGRAHALHGVLCLTSAALHHGWAVKRVPEHPHVSVPRNRKVTPARRAGVILHRHDLHPDEVDGIATTKETTLLQCLRTLPFDEALCIVDSAARAGECSLLHRVGQQARG